MIGSVVSGIAAVAVGADISGLVGAYHGGSEPYIYVNAAGEILEALTVVWILLLFACIAHALARRARDRRATTVTASEVAGRAAPDRQRPGTKHLAPDGFSNSSPALATMVSAATSRPITSRSACPNGQASRI